MTVPPRVFWGLFACLCLLFTGKLCRLCFPRRQKLFDLNDANDFGLGDFGVIWGPDGGMNVRYTGLPDQGPLNQNFMYVGKLYEVNFSGVQLHPMHLHVVPWQLQTVGVNTTWLQPGDYMDVMPGFQALCLRSVS